MFEPGVPSGESQPAPDAASASTTDGAPESGGPDMTSPTPAAQGGAELLARLAQTARDLELAERIARIGSWTLDPATGRATWSTEMYRILGLDPAGPPIDLAEIGRIFTPESVARVGEAVERTLATGEPWHLDLEFVRPDGRHGWVVSNGIAERDASGRVVLIRGTMQDVTEQGELEAQLRQAQRLEAIGQLAGGIAHDFNNLLTAIRGYAELVLANLAPNDPNRPDIEQIVVAADRATELIRQLLAFSRRQVLRPAVVDPQELVERIAPLLRRLLGEHIEVITAVAPGVGRIRVDPTQFEQVIVNLAVNARDAMPDGGTLQFELGKFHLLPGETPPIADMPPGNWIRISVRDSGIGIPEENMVHIFEPFFTTKPVGQGTGLGLAQVYGIVRQHEGFIEVHSQPGAGTAFNIYLPAQTALEAETPHPELQVEVNGAGRKVLVVEDDPTTLKALQTLLEARQYQVLAAANGAKALRDFEAEMETVDLVISDIVMPEMGGLALYRITSERWPHIRMLFITGHPLDGESQALLEKGEVAWLQKPFSIQQFNRAIQALMQDKLHQAM